MDLFRAATTPEERFLLVAERLAVAISRALTLLTPDVRAEVAPYLDADRAWALALLLSGWRHAAAYPRVQELIASLGASSALGQVGSVAQLRDSAAAAERATSDAELRTSAGYFAAAIQDLGANVVRIALGSAVFRKLHQGLLRAFPRPAELAPLFAQQQSGARDEEEVTRAYLRRLGWPEAAVAGLIRGPR